MSLETSQIFRLLQIPPSIAVLPDLDSPLRFRAKALEFSLLFVIIETAFRFCQMEARSVFARMSGPDERKIGCGLLMLGIYFQDRL